MSDTVVTNTRFYFSLKDQSKVTFLEGLCYPCLFCFIFHIYLYLCMSIFLALALFLSIYLSSLSLSLSLSSIYIYAYIFTCIFRGLMRSCPGHLRAGAWLNASKGIGALPKCVAPHRVWAWYKSVWIYCLALKKIICTYIWGLWTLMCVCIYNF